MIASEVEIDGPRVVVFSGATGLPLASFFAYEQSFYGGVSVTATDFTGKGRADILVGAGTEGGPSVRLFDLTVGRAAPDEQLSVMPDLQ